MKAAYRDDWDPSSDKMAFSDVTALQKIESNSRSRTQPWGTPSHIALVQIYDNLKM